MIVLLWVYAVLRFPCTCVPGLYRNPMAETARFLQTYHRDRAKVYNLCSEHYYHPNKLLAPVKHLPFDDHQVCKCTRYVCTCALFGHTVDGTVDGMLCILRVRLTML
eukprot:GHRR01030414.1.p1 GENE.GHRR01030414.1~~GHRR01030414.1.p1  ORF type:complete len:107 (+),score=10.28 GHRR01030414.1:340-660(+)